MSDYVYREFPKWVRGVDHHGNVVSMIVQGESEETEQAERIKVLEGATASATGTARAGRRKAGTAPADDAGESEETEQAGGTGA